VTQDRKEIGSVDIVSVLTKVVQEQQGFIQEQQKSILALREELNYIKEKVR